MNFNPASLRRANPVSQCAYKSISVSQSLSSRLGVRGMLRILTPCNYRFFCIKAISGTWYVSLFSLGTAWPSTEHHLIGSAADRGACMTSVCRSSGVIFLKLHLHLRYVSDPYKTYNSRKNCGNRFWNFDYLSIASNSTVCIWRNWITLHVN